MKISNVLKALGAAAALAAVVPVRVKKDDATGKKKYQSLLLSVDVGPGEGGEGTDIGVNFGEGVLTGAVSGLARSRQEAELFADDEPEAAVVDAEELQIIADEAQEAADEAQAIADVAQEAADEAQAIADEAQAIADEAAETAEAPQAADDDGDTDSEV